MSNLQNIGTGIFCFIFAVASIYIVIDLTNETKNGTIDNGQTVKEIEKTFDDVPDDVMSFSEPVLVEDKLLELRDSKAPNNEVGKLAEDFLKELWYIDIQMSNSHKFDTEIRCFVYNINQFSCVNLN